MKSFYGYPSRLRSSIAIWLTNTLRLGRKGLSAVASRNRFLVLTGGLGLSLLLVWAVAKPDTFRQSAQGLRQATLLKAEGVKLTFSKDQSVEYTLNAPHQQWIPEAGLSISTAKNLGRTNIAVSHKTVKIDQRPSIRKVVGIHPEHDEDLDAEMLFSYTDAELDGLDENNLILYSSVDEGVTWQPHLNSVRDIAMNTIRVEGIRHFSLWTAAGTFVVQGPGCVTTGIGAWWRSDIGASPTAWTDFSTNGYNATVVGVPVFNAAGANFNPAINLTNDYYHYTVGIFKNNPGIVNSKVFTVVLPINGQLMTSWSERASNGQPYQLHAPWSNDYTYHDAPYGYRVYNNFTANGGKYGVPNIIAGERTQNNMSIRTNGKVQNFAGSYGGTFTSNTNLNYLGAVAGYPSVGGLAEIIVYRDASSMTAVQVQKIESYLALKYGITLDQTTPRDYLAGSGAKMWDATVNAAYKYNVAGIGREDCQTFHQKQSKSINPSQFITFATGSSIAADNATNATAVAADNSFLVWGDNNASQTTTVAVAGVNVNDRMTRVWRVDKTNWTDQNITIKAAGYANRYFIIHNTSATFATAPSQEILLDATGSATFNSSLLPDGAYFTFGNVVKGPACLNTGVGAWWRADQELSSTQWKDFSGNGYDANAVGVTAIQTTGANYNPFVKLNSSYYQYNNGVFKGAGMMNSKVFTVTVPVNGQLTVAWAERASNGANYNVHAPWSNDYSYFDAPWGYRQYNNFTANGGHYNVPNIVTGERTTTNMAIRTNGKVQNFPGNYPGNYPSNTIYNYVGAVYGYPSTGGTGVAEVIVYRDASALTATDVQKIESYLALKYGITLDQTSAQDYLASDGSKMWDASVNAAFRYNVAGMGRDNCNVLYQKQSKSVNPAQFITFALGSSVAVSNAANTGTIANDKSFLTWGDNNASLSTVVAVSAVNTTERMSRVWRVDKTNWTDQTITFQATGYANRYLLIHNTSASFATAPTQEIQLDATGAATFNSSLLPDGAYFTLGSIFQGPGCVNVGIGGWWRSDQFASPTEWKDFSGNEHTALGEAGTPIFDNGGANFNPSIKFNGGYFYRYTDGVFKTTSINNSKVFTVVTPISGARNYPWGEYTTNGQSYWLLAPHIDNLTYHDAPYGYRVTNGFAANGGQFGVPNIVAGERTQTNMSIRTNGKVQNFPGNYPGTFTSHTTANTLGAVNQYPSTGGFGVSEVIVYRDASAMTPTDVQKIESYLALKYGITLDQTTARDYLAGNGTTKMWDATANAAFKFNIAGLGRDNCQLLHQKQSKSVNPTQFITVALGDSIATSNGTNGKTITTDNSYLVWGDNNASRFTSAVITGSSNVTGRMNRVWRVDKTNWTDQNITFRAAGYANRYLLIHNTDAAFATAPSQEILLDATGTATFNSSLLPDGAYFTIGNALLGPGCVNSGIGAWWKSDFEMTSTYWNDYSGNGKNTFNQGVPVPQATGANYNPFVKFNNTYYKYTEGIFKDAPGIVNSKIFEVVIPISGQYNNPWGEYTTNGYSYFIHAPHNNDVIYHDAPYGYRVTSGFTASGGQYGVPNILAGERSQTNMSIRTNGKVQNFPGSYPGTFLTNSTENFVGAVPGLPSSGGSGTAEVIVYRDASSLTATDVQKIESYLALKYGITLDQTTARDYLAGNGTTKMWDATANAAYKFNIAGLGKDLCQQLHQKQSKSVNPSQFIVMALGDSIATSNQTNGKSVTADNSFLVWGDNNGNRFGTTAVTATNVTSRMNRVWRVDKTNWTDQNVTFQAQGYPNRYLLIHNTSATFATAPSQEILLDATGKATFSSSLFPDGAYFTIGDAILGPGCVNVGVGAWWKADYEMDVAHWSDYSGNEKNALPGVGVPASTPFVSGANFNPLVKINGGNGHYQYNGNPIFNAGMTNARIFAVTLPLSGGNGIVWGEGMNNGQNTALWATATDNNLYFDAPFGYRVSGPFTTNNGNFGVPNLTVAVRTATNMAIRLQGKDVVNTPAAFATFTSTGAAHIGAYPGLGASAGFGIAEVIVYRDATAMNATDLQKIESYLALKYGITLDQSTPRDYLASNGTTKMWDGTANAAFRFNIAGMGKDICQQLNQKASRSVNPNQFVTFAVGGNITVDNKTNTSTITNDRSFLTWGDNNGTLLTSVAVNATNVSERSGRVWRVDKTNWADQDITFQAIGYPNRYLLIHNTDPTFSTNPTAEVKLDGAGTATFSSSLLPDGAYFTLGNILVGPGCVNVGVATWFDASEAELGNMVDGTGWQDKSGWGRHMSTTSVGQAPTVQSNLANFNQGTYFDGGDAVWQPSYGTAFTEGEVFSVGHRLDVGNRGPMFDFGGMSGTASHYTFGDGAVYEAFGTTNRPGFNPQTNVVTAGGVTINASSPPVNASNWNIYNVGATATDWFAGFNGITKASRASNTVAFAGNTNMHIGWRQTAYFYGNVSEVVHYNRKLTAVERQRVHSYLGLKYGITLDQTTPYNYVATNNSVYWDATANAAYKSNIAGIGRDDCTNLNQKQSKSINASQFITMAVGTEIAASNPANGGIIGTDRSFLVWGDNNLSAAVPAAVTATNVTERMSRVWRVDKTVNWGEQNITFQAKGYPYRYLLIHNTDGAFATAPTQEIQLDTFGIATFNSSLLPDGAYFTIGDAVKGPGCVNLGTVLWLKADYGLTTGALWEDYSGNENDFTQTVAGERPTVVAGDVTTNFNPGLLFASTKNLERASGLLATGGGTVVAAVKHTNLAATWGDIYNQATDNPTFGKWTGVGNMKVYDAGVHVVNDVALSFIESQNHIAGYDYGTTANSYTAYMDGKGFNVTSPAPSIVAGTAYLGGENTLENWVGNIYEVAIYNRELTAPELQRVNSYFGIKYGITIDQTTPTDYLASNITTKMWDATANAAYRYNIAGLGRDMCSLVHQKQSKSANANQFVTFAIGDTIQVNNAANSKTIATDHSFLFWGDDNGSRTTEVAATGTNVTSRMVRVWKVDKTNWTDQNITIEMTGYANRYLIISNTSATFATINQEILLDATGKATFSSSLLPDGAYFTIGNAFKGPGCVTAGVKAWMKADFGTSSGAEWNDYSGNGIVFSQPTVANQPTLNTGTAATNFNPTFTFAATQNLQIASGLLANGGGTVVSAVMHTNVTAPWGNVYNQSLADPAFGKWNGVANMMIYDNGVYGANGITLSFIQNQNHIANYDYGAGANSYTAYLDGKSLNLTTPAPTIVPGIGSIGGELTAETWLGNIYEVAFYNRELTATELQRVNSYFGLKYGITVDQTTPTDYIAGNGTTKMWEAATNTGYNNDIAGIGRDNCQTLNQKQSRSANSDDIVTMGSGTIAATNAENVADLTDVTFMMWGNNNGTIAWQTTETPVSRMRLTREWKIDETGTVTGVQIQVPDNSSALASKLPAEATTVYLLVDADGDFSSGATEVAMALNGTNWEANIDFTDGQYFTFATQLPPAPGCVVNNLNLWLKGDASFTSTLWVDQSLSGNDAAQATVANQPVSDSSTVINFNPAPKFDGTNDYMTFSNNLGLSGNTNDFTVFAVTRQLNITGSQAFLGGVTATPPQFVAWHVSGAPGEAVGGGGATCTTTSSNALVAGGTGISSIVRASNVVTAALNSTGAVSNTCTANFAVQNMQIGSRNATSNPFNGLIAETIIYNKALSAAEQQRVSSYLAVKYGITLTQDYIAASGATIWDVGGTGGYDNDIAGIGREDCQLLLQKQSKSNNSDALLTIGNGNLIAPTNPTNSSTFPADVSYMLWGNNNGSITWQLAETPVNRQRLTREWRVTETGTIGSVKVRLPDNGSALTSKLPAEVGTVYLLTDADGDFSSGATEVAMTLNGTDWEGNVDLTNGQYFTFATNVPAVPGCVAGNLSLWLKADLGVIGSPAVTAWADQSIYSNPITVVGAPQITSTINFNPAIALSAGRYFTTPNAAHLNPTASKITIFGVTRPTTVGINPIIGKTDVAGWNNGYGMYGNSNQKVGFWQGDQTGVEPANVPHQAYPNTPFVSTGYYDTNQKVSVNGATATSAVQTPTLSTSQVEIGFAKTFQFTGDYAEVLLYNDDVGATGRNKIETYLAVKYGITLAHDYLAGAGTTIWDVGGTGGYDNDVAGIGREDCSGLEQKQSKSVNADALVTMGNGNSIATTNAANAALFSVDASFLMWGNNDGAIAFQTTEAPTNRQRLTREWRITETGTVGSVKIRVPDNSSALASKLPAEITTIYLLVDDDGDFSSGATEMSMALTGTDWEVDADLLNGKYFTFATETCNPLITGNPVDVTLCAGGNATFTASAFGSGLTYQWQENTGSGFVNIGGATSASYTKNAVTAAMNGYQYQVVVSNSCPPSATSTAATLTVNTPPAITVQPTASAVCVGASVNLEVIATGTALTYQWQEDSGSGFADIAGATSQLYSFTAASAMNGHKYHVIISGTCTPTVTSSDVTLTVNDLPAITTQPVDTVTVCAGTNATFSVVATGAGLTYQWQEDAGSGFVNIAGATSASYTKTAPTAAMSGYLYQVIVSGTCTPPVTSEVATLIVNGVPAITTQPTAQTVCAGADATFAVVATGAGLTYQWQENTGSGFVNIPGATSASYTKAATTVAMNTYQYQVIVSGTCTPPVTSSAVVLTVNAAPAITTQPTAQTVCAGANATFTVVATGAGLTYQWQEDAGSGFVNIAGATSASYTKAATTVAMNGYMYQVIVSGTCTPPVTSSAVALTVNALPAITTQPTAQTVCAGADATFTVVATGAGLTYQWQENTGSGFVNIAGATSASYTKAATTAVMSGYTYQVIVSGTCTPPVTSSAVALTVNALPSITTQPTAQTVCAGADATFTVVAAGAGLTYQWQENTGSGFVNITGATSASYTKAATTVAMSGYTYQVIVSGTCTPPVTSSAVALTVNALPAITTQPTAQTVCAGADATFTVVATGTGLTYQWQENTGSGFVNIASATSASYTKAATTVVMNGYTYQVIVSGTCTPPVTSSAVSLTVGGVPAITTQPTGQTVCAGADAAFAVVATGAGLTYQWQENTGSGFANIAGATSTSYTKAATTVAMSGYTYQVIVSGTCTPPVTSSAVALTVNALPSITTQPTAQTVCAGANATFTVVAAGAGLTYQWQENTGSGFVNIAGATSASYTKAATTAVMNGYQYQVIVGGTCAPPVTSSAVALTVNAAPAITTQPASTAVCVGADATFAVVATGAGLTYQWQENTGSGFVNIVGATGASYTKTSTTVAMNTYTYQVIITGTCTPPVTSNAATLTVNALPAITAQPANATLCEGNNANFNVTATGAGLTYQWQENTGSGFVNIAGATASLYIKSSVTAAMSGYQYRVIVSGTCSPSVTSNAVALTVNTLPAITTQPAAVTNCTGANAVFTVVATGSGLTYQWQEDTGSGFVNIAGATSPSYTKTSITAAMNGYQYQVIVTGTCAPAVTSSAALLTVTTAPAITAQPVSVTTCAGANAVFSVTTTGAGVAYQWQVDDGSGPGFVDIPGATSATYTRAAVSSAFNGYLYRVIVGGVCPPSVTSSVATLTVQPAPSISTQPASQVACVASNATFSVVAAGAGLTYQWQENTGSGFVNIAGATSSSYTKAGITVAMNGYTYQVIVTGACAPPVTSSVATLTVDAPPTITTQPVSATVCEGANATFTTVATGASVTYQWQENTGSGFVNIAGATSASYTKTATTAAMSGYTYQVIVTGACSPPATSNVATLTVNTPPAITTQPAAVTLCDGANATFTVVATGTGLTYQWQENTGSGFVNIAGATSASYTKAATTAAMNNYQYQVIITGTCSPAITSSAAILTVNSIPFILTQPSSVTTCVGTNAIFNVMATGSGLTYQWQENTGSGFVNIPGASSSNYTKTAVTLAMSGYQYQVIVTGTCTPVLTSNAVALTVNALPTAVIVESDNSCIANDGSIATGGSATLTASGGATYLWENSSTAAVRVVSPVTTTTYSVTVTSAAGCTAVQTTTVLVVANCGDVVLAAKAFLGGPYEDATDLMKDNLRTANLIPNAQPYGGADYTDFGYAGTETLGAGVLTPVGPNAIVDWVLVELHNSANPATIVARKAGLIQRDGDIVSPADGTSALSFAGTGPGNYYVSIHHRNHLGVMTATAVALSATATPLDFTSASTNMYQLPGGNGTAYAQRTLNNGKRALWDGNLSNDNSSGNLIQFQGGTSDSDGAYFRVLLDPGNGSVTPNYFLNGYERTDGNMDGQVIFQGGTSDADIPFFNVLTFPDNGGNAPNYIIYQQIP